MCVLDAEVCIDESRERARSHGEESNRWLGHTRKCVFVLRCTRRRRKQKKNSRSVAAVPNDTPLTINRISTTSNIHIDISLAWFPQETPAATASATAVAPAATITASQWQNVEEKQKPEAKLCTTNISFAYTLHISMALVDHFRRECRDVFSCRTGEYCMA